MKWIYVVEHREFPIDINIDRWRVTKAFVSKEEVDKYVNEYHSDYASENIRVNDIALYDSIEDLRTVNCPII